MPFKGAVTDWRKGLLTEQLEANLVSWLSHSLLEIGAYENVARGAQDPAGGDRSRLSADTDPRYVANTRWKAPRASWVWQPSTSYSVQPIVASGVWVNGSFVASTGGTSPYIDFPRGQVVFSSGIPASSTVQVAHSPMLVQVRRTDEPWFQSFGFNSFVAGSEKSQEALAENRVQLPLLLVEPVFNGAMTPLEVGSFAGAYRTDFLIHAFGETPWDRKRLHDILLVQQDGRIPTFDVNVAPPPLDRLGRPKPLAMTHPQLCAAHPWRQARVEKVTSTPQEVNSRNLWWSTVRWGVSVDNP